MGKQKVCRHGSIHYRCNVFRDVQAGARIARYTADMCKDNGRLEG